LTDFDLSKDMLGLTQATGRQAAVGTAGYMASELLSQQPQYSQGSDVFALGATAVLALVLDGDYERAPQRRHPSTGPDFGASLARAHVGILGLQENVQRLWVTLQAQLKLALGSSVAKRPSAGFLRDAFAQRVCLICQAEDALETVACPTSSHFTCLDCIANQVRISINDSKSAGSGLFGICCSDCKEAGGWFTNHELGQKLPKDLYCDLQDAKMRFAIELARKEGELQGRAMAEAELRKSAAVKFRQSLENDVMTFTCPRCKTAIERIDGCITMTCRNRIGLTGTQCNSFFCYICRFQGSSEIRTQLHCNVCPFNPERETHEAFCSEPAAMQGRKRWQRQEFTKRLDGLGEFRAGILNDEGVKRLMDELEMER
jgi:hypothetical protein